MGIVFIIIAQFLWALEFIIIRKFFPTQNSFVISAITCVFATLFYVPAFVMQKVKFSLREWILLGVIGFFIISL
ncbi:hypothetical protein COY90_02950 [Candidatus Roizmanbacteria bacterium CG_4_10_14_0_8_um_filter_39_9]|uniref:EamA domain-containing protein n=1 Tax=Candidatus Roizmanbacteria bacterium CG_4_10_14_0_8_um_filter_39_9 TaxID=1974829 RepID=A0A2M7QDR5_9BACT|nr:MAG: hypothetical protein COY90_02950 [Candidatus Roizmanbacteria bacterium CG_4_10_14_0_8_um_filter_39_9]